MGLRERGLHGLGKPTPHTFLHHQAVDDDTHVVPYVLVEIGQFFVEAVLHPVDLHPRETLLADVLQQILVPALLTAHYRSLDNETSAGLQSQDLVHDLLLALSLDGPAADPAVRTADARIEQPEVVVDLGDRAYSGTRIARGGLLVDGYRRRESFDGIDIGLVHLP